MAHIQAVRDYDRRKDEGGGAMTGGYGTHREYMEWVAESVDDRKKEMQKNLREAFKEYIETREVDVILFSKISVDELAKALMKFPSVLKPIMASCNIAARSVELDLGIRNLNTYEPKLDEKTAYAIAGYLKPELPSYMEIPGLVLIDRASFVDKEVRKLKGQWEKRILDTLNKISDLTFKKRKFTFNSEEYEIDAAYPIEEDITVGIDIKRIEARRDTHKRCDEIVNKANKLKATFPDSYFIAVIYYPFIDEHVNIQSRLKVLKIDLVIFASQDENNIQNACKTIIRTLQEAKHLLGDI